MTGNIGSITITCPTNYAIVTSQSSFVLVICNIIARYMLKRCSISPVQFYVKNVSVNVMFAYFESYKCVMSTKKFAHVSIKNIHASILSLYFQEHLLLIF